MCVELCPLHPIPLHILKFDLECYVLSFNVIAQRCEAAHARVAIESSIHYYHFHRPLVLFELGLYNKSRRHQPRFYLSIVFGQSQYLFCPPADTGQSLLRSPADRNL